jgi:hypothetical protein
MVTRMSLHCQTCCQGWKRVTVVGEYRPQQHAPQLLSAPQQFQLRAAFSLPLLLSAAPCGINFKA